MEVRNCPFCGTKPMVKRGCVKVDDDEEGKITVPFRLFCPYCGVQMRKDAKFAATEDGQIVMLGDGYMELLRKWNRRAKE